VTLNLNRLNTVVNPLNANCEINSIFFVTKDLFTARQMIEELVVRTAIFSAHESGFSSGFGCSVQRNLSHDDWVKDSEKIIDT
jgi:hypothetical protein